MSQLFRLPDGGRIDRGRTLSFTFNGWRYQGHPGDTLASALLANGEHLVARSLKLHRPRGITAAGPAEPNALVQLGEGGRSTPNLKATEIELFDGLVARSVNCFPTPRIDVGAAIGLANGLFPAGFYYKTFHGSLSLWRHVWEPLIRRAAGWGRAAAEPDPDVYDRMYIHCDVMVVGGGPAGLNAARAAADSGARVVLADEQPEFGGSLLERRCTLGGKPGADWAAAQAAALGGMPEVTLLPRTTVFGHYDQNYLVALERRGDHTGAPSSAAAPRQRVWHVRARRVILATGAHERAPVFPDNDRPGVMLAGAVSAYVNRWAVLPGRKAVLFANNDAAYAVVHDLLAAGAEVGAVVDSRTEPPKYLMEPLRDRGVPVAANSVVAGLRGRGHIRAVCISPREGGRSAWLACDLLVVSGGFSPCVHLLAQAQGSLRYDAGSACFRPETIPPDIAVVGAANAEFGLDAALREAGKAGAGAARDCGFEARAPRLPKLEEVRPYAVDPLWEVPLGGAGKRFVDFQNDTTAEDIRLAAREGFDSVELMKRYTLTGFGTDQGKSGNVNAIGILSAATGVPMGAIGTTTFRPPYTPVTFGALGGRDRSAWLDPERLTPMHDWHVAHGAAFEDVGQWRRPRHYPRGGEDMEAAVARECHTVRNGVGILDASTLGKIDIQGPDAAEFLNRVYINAWTRLAVGKVRYGVMCREDGMVFDDGTTARLDENRYLMTTTTGGAGPVLDHLEEYLQTEWPALRVRLTSVTEQWATVALAGPKSGAVLRALAPSLDTAPAAFPFMSWQDAVVAGVPARVFRISFTGELQFEVNVPWHLGPHLWEAAMAAGEPYGITPYGTEAMHVLRAEKGFIIVGQETDGSQTPEDLGFGGMISNAKDFIGKRSLARPDSRRADRRQLVALLPEDPMRALPEGAQLVERGMSAARRPVRMLGFVTSSYWSGTLNRHFALALIAGGRARHGEVVEAALSAGGVPVRIADPNLHDPEGRRRDGH